VCVLFLSELKGLLREFYQKEYADIQYVPTRPDKQCSFREVFVVPKLVKKDHRLTEDEGKKAEGETVTTYQKVFENDNGLCSNVFVVGEAGSGKSSLSQNISLIWSEESNKGGAQGNSQGTHFTDVDIIRQFEFVFHVALRDSCHQCNYVEMIYDQLLYRLYNNSQDRKTAYALVEEVLETSNCLIVADGLDEWFHPDEPCKCPSKEKGTRPLIHQKNRAVILLTSRPVGFTRIPENKVDNYLEIEGAEDVKQLGENILKVLNGNTGTKRFEDFESSVKENAVWDNLLQSPILLIQMICLWHDNHELSKSISITYTSIFEMLIGRVKDGFGASQNVTLDNTSPNIFGTMTNIKNHWTNFTDLCELAYKQLFRKSGHPAVVFSSEDCKDELKHFAVKCGILTEKKSKSVSFRSYHLSFQHKTFQEFLSAVHLSLHSDLLASDIEFRYHDYWETFTVLGNTFIFLCALNGNIAGKMSAFLNKLDENDPKVLLSRGFREALYAGNLDIHLACPRKIQIDSPRATDIQFYRKWIWINKNHIQNITLKGCEKDFDFGILTSMQELLFVELNKTSIGDFQLQLPEGVVEITMINVTLSRGDFINDLPRLKYVNLFGMSLDYLKLHLPSSVTNVRLYDVSMYRYFLFELPQLQHVFLESMDISYIQIPTSITDIDLKNVTSNSNDILLPLSNLRYVGLWKVNLAYIHVPSSVTAIHLNQVTITRRDFFKDLPKLQTVKFSKIIIGDLQLHLPSSVTKVEMINTTLTLGNFLHDLPKLQYVRLCDMNFTYLQFLFSANFVLLENVTMSVGAMLRLVDGLERTPHAITCDVEQCIVKPADQIERIEKRIRESTSLECLSYSIVDEINHIFTFSLQRCIKTNEKDI